MGKKETHELLKELTWGYDSDHDSMIIDWAFSEIESGAEAEALLRIVGYSPCFGIAAQKGQLRDLLRNAMDELGYLWRDYQGDYLEFVNYQCDKVAAGSQSFSDACKRVLDEAADLRGFFFESKPYYPIFLGFSNRVESGKVSEVTACYLLCALFEFICDNLPYLGPRPRPHDDVDLIRLLDESSFHWFLAYCD